MRGAGEQNPLHRGLASGGLRDTLRASVNREIPNRTGRVLSDGVLALGGGVQLDARRAVWLEPQRTLLVADVHLGYVWAERQRGALLPLVEEDAGARLCELLDVYPAERLVLLGDTVHATARNQVLEEELAAVLELLTGRVALEFVIGNHDVNLASMLARLGVERPAARCLSAGPHVLVHGDGFGWCDVAGGLGSDGWVFSGHEHPAVRLGDGVATEVRVPAFLVGERRVILPAFSRWSAGQVCGRQAPLSPLTDPDALHHAVAVLGHRLLPLALARDGTVTPCAAIPDPSPLL